MINMKKIKIILLIIFYILIIFSVSSYADFQDIEIKKSKEFEKWENLPEEEKKETIQPVFSEIPIKDSIKRSTYNILTSQVGNSIYGEKYDLSKEINIKVKNQKHIRGCWAFSYTSMVETTLFRKYKDEYREFSPMHVDYVATRLYNKKLGNEGIDYMTIAYSANRLGPVYEKDFPLESVYDEEKNSKDNYYLSDVNSVSTDKEDVVKIEDIQIFPRIYKEFADSNIKYFSGNQEISKEEVTRIRELIKKHIKEKGAIRSNIYMTLNENMEFYNQETNAYYHNDLEKMPNHSITIVGWDDEYPVENFNEKHRPINKGAYIALNSYGKDFGDSGYFYISYDDGNIDYYSIGINSLSMYDNENTKADYIYQYDELGANYSIPFDLPGIYAANKFKKKSNQVEYLDEIGINILNTEGIEVYISKDGELLNYGNPVADYTGNNALEAGYHIIKLTSPIKLENENFAIIIKYINTEGAKVPIECNFTDSNISNKTTYYDTASSNLGESYISADGEKWRDIDGLAIKSDCILKNTNACIKAFTKLANLEPEDQEPEDEKPENIVNVTGVSLNKEKETIEVGDKINLVATIKPNNATNKNVEWKSSDEKVATISKEGIITAITEGKTIITVTTEDGKYTANCEITVTKKTNTDDDIYKEDNNNETIIKNEKYAKEDHTIANKEVLPFTGTKVVVIVLILIIIAGVIFYINYKKYNEVK